MLWQIRLHEQSIFICIISAYAYICACKKTTLAIYMTRTAYQIITWNSTWLFFEMTLQIGNRTMLIIEWSRDPVCVCVCVCVCVGGGVVGLTRWLPVVLMSRVITSYLFVRFGELKINRAENWPHFVLINYVRAKPASCIFDYFFC
jgi:hypothetical protein